MALTISNIGSILKKIIIPVIQDTLPKESVLFDKIKKNSGVILSNNIVYVASRVGRSSGVYTVAEGTEPRVGKSTYANPYASIAYTFGTLELTDQALEAAAKGDSTKAIASILSAEVKALKDDIRKDVNRQFWGDGTGRLCLANGTGVVATATLTVDSPGVRYLDVGMYIVIGTSSAVAITAKTSPTTVTIGTGSAAWANNTVVYKENTADMMGLKGIIDNGTYVATIQNITRSTNDWANAQIEGTAATLTEAQMIDIYLAAMEYGKPSVWFTGPSGFSKYGQLLTSIKRTADLKEILAGGWRGLEFMDIGVMVDYDVPDYGASEYSLYLVDFDTLTIAEMSEAFVWLEADAHGGILRRSPDVRTNWEGTLKYYAQLVGKAFQSNGALLNKQK